MTNSYCCKVNKVVCIEGDPTHHLLGSIDAVVLIIIVILVINISIKKYMSRFKTNFILDPNKWCVGSPQNILLISLFKLNEKKNLKQFSYSMRSFVFTKILVFKLGFHFGLSEIT